MGFSTDALCAFSYLQLQQGSPWLLHLPAVKERENPTTPLKNKKHLHE